MLQKKLSLRSFITVTVTFIVAVILLCSVLFYYRHTSSILREHSQESIVRQLNQVNSLITEQIDSIDSVIPLFLSNTMILEALEEPDSAVSWQNQRFHIERQMSYIYSSTLLFSKNYACSVYLIRNDGSVFYTCSSGITEDTKCISREIQNHMDLSYSHLLCFTLPSDIKNLYFARNLYNSNTGERMGILALSIDSEKWMDYCTKGLNPAWFITLYNSDIQILSDKTMQPQNTELQQKLSLTGKETSFQEMNLCEASYYTAARALSKLDLTCAVSAPKELLLRDLNDTLTSYLILLCAVSLIALSAAVILSRAVTRPIDYMVSQINRIAVGSQTRMQSVKLYQEFSLWSDAFNDMLQRLDASYQDNLQKQLLLKNAEIQALQSQMDPHFVFNILNTIAWKAQMTDNEEIYQMVISLGELLRMNTLSKENPFVTLEKEMEYVRLYLYLQQMRFEDKISCTIQIPENLMQCKIPCFCIQPLVENAIVHGLEPKKGKGKLIIQVFQPSEELIEICIIDNGVGFTEIPDIRSLSGENRNGHTHIGLKNLDKRLELLFDENARLQISSTPNVSTILSFQIPFQKGDAL